MSPYELSSNENTTIWMGDLEPWMTADYIQRVWSNLSKEVSVKVIKDKATGLNSVYAFVDFGSRTIARKAIKYFNGLLMPNSNRTFKLNWASGEVGKREEYSIFIGDLGYTTTEEEVLPIFKSRYSSCTSVKIMMDFRTGMTRGYGFVRFSDHLDQRRALVEMQAYIIGSRPIRVSPATPKQKSPTVTLSPQFSAGYRTTPQRQPLYNPHSFILSPVKPILPSSLFHDLSISNTKANLLANLWAPVETRRFVYN